MHNDKAEEIHKTLDDGRDKEKASMIIKTLRVRWKSPVSNTTTYPFESTTLEPTQYQPILQFVQGLGSQEDRKRSRAHVTLQHYRRKRFDARRARRQTILTKQYVSVAANNKRSSSQPSEPLPINDREGWDRQITASENPPSPLVMVQGARSDPFQSYPVAATAEIHRLVDHYNYVMPSMYYKSWSQALRRPRSCWTLFKLYRTDAAAFLGMLYHTARHLSSIQGQRNSVQALHFQHEALKVINLRLQKSLGPHDDGTVIAVGLLANGERLWGDSENAKFHWAALKRMILDRGGFPAMRHNPSLHTKLVWSYIALSWLDPLGVSSDTFADSSVYIAGSDENESGSCPLTTRREFNQFLTTRRNQVRTRNQSFLNQHQQRNSDADEDRTQNIRDLLSPSDIAFSPTSRLYAALLPQQFNLTFLPTSISTSSEASDHYYHYQPHARRALENTRLGSLLFLNFILADYAHPSSMQDAYFNNLIELSEDEKDDTALTTEHLLWTLLSEEGQLLDHYERCWKLVRFMGLVKQMDAPEWMDTERRLWGFLIGMAS